MCVQIEKLPKTLLLLEIDMDNLQLVETINRCKLLKYRFRGIFPTDLPCSSELKNDNTFMIMNASPSVQPGTHWLFLLKLEDRYSSQIL